MIFSVKFATILAALVASAQAAPPPGTDWRRGAPSAPGSDWKRNELSPAATRWRRDEPYIPGSLLKRDEASASVPVPSASVISSFPVPSVSVISSFPVPSPSVISSFAVPSASVVSSFLSVPSASVVSSFPSIPSPSVISSFPSIPSASLLSSAPGVPSTLLPSETAASASAPIPSPTGEEVIINPSVTGPTALSVWPVGSAQTITWDTSAIPDEYKNETGLLLLGYSEDNSEHLDINNPLGTQFPIGQGSLDITVPNVTTRNDYIVVLFGDSGNASPLFTISQ